MDRFDEARSVIDMWHLDVVIIQFNFGFYDFDHFPTFISRLIDDGKIVVVVLHSTIDPKHEPERKLEKLIPALSRCDRLLVHSINDMNRLKLYGLVDNVALFPHGVLAPKTSPTVANSSRNHTVYIASYGFFLPHKGLLELIEAIRLLRDKGHDYRLILVNSEFPTELSHRAIQQAKALIGRHSLWPYVDLRTDFLSDEESLALLSRADIIVYPYQATAELASGAVRYGLAAGRPVAVTPLPIFDELKGCIFELPGPSPEQIAVGLEQLVAEAAADTLEFRERHQRAQWWRENHAYPVVADRLRGLLKGVFREKALPIVDTE